MGAIDGELFGCRIGGRHLLGHPLPDPAARPAMVATIDHRRFTMLNQPILTIQALGLKMQEKIHIFSF
jgi:hypothetical protein